MVFKSHWNITGRELTTHAIQDYAFLKYIVPFVKHHFHFEYDFVGFNNGSVGVSNFGKDRDGDKTWSLMPVVAAVHFLGFNLWKGVT